MNNRYKTAMQAEKFDEKKLDELINVLESYEPEKESETNGSSPEKPKKIHLSVILAAALAIAAIGCTTVAAAGESGLFKFTKTEVDLPPLKAAPTVNTTDIVLDAEPIASISEPQPKDAPRMESGSFYDYFADWKIQHEISEDLPLADDPYDYAKEVCINAVYVDTSYLKLPPKKRSERTADSLPPAKTDPKIIPQIVAILGDGEEVCFDIAVDASALELPDDLPEDAMFGFRRTVPRWKDSWDDSDILLSNLKRIPFQEDGIYRYTYREWHMAFSESHSQLYDDKRYQLFLYDFGYSTGDDEFIALEEGKFILSVDYDDCKTAKGIKKVSGIKEVRGVMTQLTLSPLSLEIATSASQQEERIDRFDKQWLCTAASPWEIQFYLRSGKVLGTESYYFDTAFYGWETSIGGRRRRPGEDPDMSVLRRGFAMPIDIDEVTAIAVHGVKFELEDMK